MFQIKLFMLQKLKLVRIYFLENINNLLYRVCTVYSGCTVQYTVCCSIQVQYFTYIHILYKKSGSRADSCTNHDGGGGCTGGRGGTNSGGRSGATPLGGTWRPQRGRSGWGKGWRGKHQQGCQRFVFFVNEHFGFLSLRKKTFILFRFRF